MTSHSVCLSLLLALIFLRSCESSKCALPWNKNTTKKLDGKTPIWKNDIDMTIKCPHGFKLIGDVTLPNPPKDEHGNELARPFSVWISVVYGYLPFAVVGMSIVEIILRSFCYLRVGTRELSFFCFVLFSTCLNEFGIKSLAKDPRPAKSCNYSCGMPSGHSTMAIGFFALLFLDSVTRVMPKIPMTVEAARREIQDMYAHGGTTFVHQLVQWKLPRKRFWKFLSLVPLSSLDVMSHNEFSRLVLFWGMLLLPVPLTRVVLEDHTPGQVMTGTCMGIIEAAAWFGCVRIMQKRYNHLLGEHVCVWIKHNYALPRFEVRSKCVLMLARAELEADGSLDLDPVDIVELQNMSREIDWYLKMTRLKMMKEDAGDEREREFLDLELINLRPLQEKVRDELRRRSEGISTGEILFTREAYTQRTSRVEMRNSERTPDGKRQKATSNYSSSTLGSGEPCKRTASDGGMQLVPLDGAQGCDSMSSPRWGNTPTHSA